MRPSRVAVPPAQPGQTSPTAPSIGSPTRNTLRQRLSALHSPPLNDLRSSIVSITSSPCRTPSMGQKPVTTPPEYASTSAVSMQHDNLRSVAQSGATPTTGFAPMPSTAEALPTRVEVDGTDGSTGQNQPSAEALLEQQYHAGEGALSSMLGHLSLGKHKHPTHTGRTPSQHRFPSHSSTTSQHTMSHPRRSSAPHSKLADPPFSPPSPPSPQTSLPRSPSSTDVALELVPYAHLVNADDCSSIASLTVTTLKRSGADVNDSPPTEPILLVLQSSGTLTLWSLQDGRQLSSIYLNRSKVYFPPPTQATRSTTHEGGFFTPLVAQGLAALRSRASSPAPGNVLKPDSGPSLLHPAATSLSMPGSPKRAEPQRPALGRTSSHNNLSGLLKDHATAPSIQAGDDVSPEWVQQDRLLQCHFVDVRVLDGPDSENGEAEQGPNPTLVALDDQRKRVVFLSLGPDGSTQVTGHISYPSGVNSSAQIAAFTTLVPSPPPSPAPQPGSLLSPTPSARSATASPVKQFAIKLVALREGRLLERTVWPNGLKVVPPQPKGEQLPKVPTNGHASNKSNGSSKSSAIPRHVLPPSSVPAVPPQDGGVRSEWSDTQALNVNIGGTRASAQGIFALGVQLVAWSTQGLGLFALCHHVYSQVESAQITTQAMSEVQVHGSSNCAVLCVRTEGGVTQWATVCHHVSSAWSVQTSSASTDTVKVQAVPVHSPSLTGYDLAVTEEDGLKVTAVHKTEGRTLPLYRQTFRSESTDATNDTVVPLSLDHIVVINPNGNSRTTQAQTLAQDGFNLGTPNNPSTSSFTAIKVVLQPMARRKLVLAGTIQGDLLLWAVWNPQEPVLLNKFHVLDSAIVRIMPFLSPELVAHGTSNVTNDFAACVAADGSVALLQVETCSVSLVVPGRGASLSLLAVQGWTLMLIYADEHARIWDLRTLELRQCVPAARAYALLAHPELSTQAIPGSSPALTKSIGNRSTTWTVHDMRDDIRGASLKVKTGILNVPDRFPPSGSQPAMEADLRKAIDAAHKAIIKSSNQQPDELGQAPLNLCPLASPGAKKALSVLSPFLAALIPGSAVPVGKSLAHALGWAEKRNGYVSGLSLRHPTSSIYASVGLYSAHLYPPVYTLQLVALLAILSTTGTISGLNADAQSFQQALLSRTTDYPFHPQSISLATLAPFAFDANPHLARAAQTLCEAALEDVPDGQVVQRITELYSASLRSVESPPPPAPQRQSIWHARRDTTPHPWSPHLSRLPADTVGLLGFLACRRLALMSPTILRDISIAIEAFLNDSMSLGNQFVAIQLCRDGFTIWQNYIDPMELLRTLFRISWADPSAPGWGSPAPGDERTEQATVRQTARHVTLHIAYVNTPLFMSTLSHDMLYPRTLADCRSSMAFVSHLVSTDPSLLLNEIPRLTEAVVRALDPPSSLLAPGTPASAKDVLRAEAIQLIDELVHTFPTISFNEPSQRLAVSTLEGGVVAYDVRAVSRLYVIEAHTTGPVDLVSFSPDGRRLVTVSLNDQGGTARVWKTGTTLASVFSLGSLPRQGGTDALGAYKAIRVHVSDQPIPAGTPMACDWIGDHAAAHLRIGTAGMSFDTS